MKEYNQQEFTDAIISALESATKASPDTLTQIDWDDLDWQWSDFIEAVYNYGVLSGLGIAKNAWDKNLGRREIRENEIYYQELIEEYLEEEE